MPCWLLAHRAAGLVERMDDPDCDPQKLRRTYVQFEIVNRLISGWGRLYSQYLRPQLHAGARSILDVGAGGGDIARMVYRNAVADGFPVQITAIDTDARAVQFMQSSTRDAMISVRHTGVGELLAGNERFDIVLSNNVLHHLSAEDIPGFLHDTHALAAALTIHSDIRRDDLAYLGFLPAHILFPGSFIAEDGLTSIRKSYCPQELRALLPPAWDVREMSLFRTLCVRRT
jgi:2-polyprenyl-3-methyl-5-hydroxy-6-metoxy-1,4-benzoquinol methylase